MATLNSSNVVNGNTISASDITALYDTFTGAATYTNIDIKGTVNTASYVAGSNVDGAVANATLATNCTNALVTSSINDATISFLKGGGGTFSIQVNNVTSSISSSYAASANVSQVGGYYDTGTINSGNLKFIAGRVPMTGGAATSSAFPVLMGKTLGTDTWITANYQNGASGGDGLMVTSISGSGEILFDGYAPGQPGSATIIFTGFYI